MKKSKIAAILFLVIFLIYGCKDSKKEAKMNLSNKEKSIALIESLESGDSTAVSYINQNKYIQHNLMAGDGLQGFAELLKHKPKEGFKAKIVRAFQDGDYVFLHTEYDFFGPKIGFDIFRFENGLIVEHWDNLIPIQPKNPSGRTQTDGEVKIVDTDKTQSNKKVVENFLNDIIYSHKMNFTDYINPSKYLQHNPAVADGLDGFSNAMKYFAENNLVMEYKKTHKILGEGNFVLTVSEGKFMKGDDSSFYDLFRLEDGKIVEHWDVIETILPKEQWKNSNGKF